MQEHLSAGGDSPGLSAKSKRTDFPARFAPKFCPKFGFDLLFCEGNHGPFGLLP